MRKNPRQVRSRLMVDSIVQATAQVIAEQGLAAASTARVAEVAGISIGSLYQYFDGRDSLYAAVLQRIIADLLALLDARSVNLGQQSLRSWVCDLLNAVWDYLEADHGLYLKVVRNWPQLDFMSGMDVLEQKLLGVLSLYVLQQQALPGVKRVDLPARIYILTNSVLFTLVRYISKPTPLASRATIITGFADLVEHALLADS